MPKPYISREIRNDHPLIQMPNEPTITWKVYFPGRQTVFMINTFTQACVIAATFGKRATAAA